jgi:hypothetical protein
MSLGSEYSEVSSDDIENNVATEGGFNFNNVYNDTITGNKAEYFYFYESKESIYKNNTATSREVGGYYNEHATVSDNIADYVADYYSVNDTIIGNTVVDGGLKLYSDSSEVRIVPAAAAGNNEAGRGGRERRGGESAAGPQPAAARGQAGPAGVRGGSAGREPADRLRGLPAPMLRALTTHAVSSAYCRAPAYPRRL